eukprot:5192743-Alexandrium_andersonii.AAC.1
MSASLVGSEMCIRDRVSSGGFSVILRAESDGDGETGRRARRRRFSGGSAVSYTHLTLPTICSV